MAIAGISLGAGQVSAAAVRHVAAAGSDTGDCTSTPCLTVQYAVDQASAGDTIAIAPGTYTGGTSIYSKDLVLRAEPGSSSLPVLSGGGTARPLTIGHSTVTVSELQIQDGVALSGGGIYTDSPLTLVNDVLSNNLATGQTGRQADGGAISTIATLTVANTIFTGNRAQNPATGPDGSDAYGGAISSSSTLKVQGSTFLGNIARGSDGTANATDPRFYNGKFAFGGAIFAGTIGDPISISASTFQGNSARGGAGSGSAPSGGSGDYGAGGIASGGAIDFNDNSRSGSSFLLTGSTFVKNAATGGDGGSGTGSALGGDAQGGAILATVSDGGSPMQLVNNTITGNDIAGGTGGGGSQGGNGGSASGAALDTRAGSSGGTAITELRNDTIDLNHASAGAGGRGSVANGGPGAVRGAVDNAGLEPIKLVNTIVASNTGGNCGSLSSSPLPADGGHNLQYPGTDCPPTIPVADPQLGGVADNGGPTQTQAITASSPAKDAGDNSACTGIPENNQDQRGYTRITSGDPVCDIGAYEYGAKGNPTAVRVTGFRVARHGRSTVFHWRMPASDAVVGFRLYAGHHPLNRLPIAAHAVPSYRYRAWGAVHGPFTLRVLLRDGSTYAITTW